MGDLRKKNIPRLILIKKKSCKEKTSEKNILHWKKISRMAYNAGKKILHRWMLGKKFFLQSFGEKILTQTKSHIHPLKSQKDDP